jgi:hypothetical protein
MGIEPTRHIIFGMNLLKHKTMHLHTLRNYTHCLFLALLFDFFRKIKYHAGIKIYACFFLSFSDTQFVYKANKILISYDIRCGEKQHLFNAHAAKCCPALFLHIYAYNIIMSIHIYYSICVPIKCTEHVGGMKACRCGCGTNNNNIFVCKFYYFFLLLT